MPEEPSKYGSNQFDSATADNASLMSEILADVMPRITAAAIAHPELVPARDLLRHERKKSGVAEHKNPLKKIAKTAKDRYRCECAI